ncbi:4-hydroxybenzoate octaprenyltransferase [Agaricicola taiwanensis]|uniref:4-hydroxybenzoate octaprenyltransferase n=1 Tax=Agaricicola taiwanensis TaxID=591372 RepID=A0A8J2VNS1_9RHOB|nr:4-hydroxybenzoate octaprenyltransferase [Agaricicola taiwanensis]GGE34429.1 4-hydroxybenzoate octaprenyltransferase [Agaricicola taiwanensis]
MIESNATIVADAVPGNWVDRHAPVWARPYLRLARLDRPIGTWLLFWPCVWGAALAAITLGFPWPNPWHIALCAIGALVMRGAGCTYNDIVDRDIDARVARTASRPLPSGQVTLKGAAAFLAAQLLVGLLVLLQFDTYTIMVGMASLVPVATYPFMKRITWWPQVMLGICFSWGALVGWSGTMGSMDAPAIALYLGALLWTIGYDTIYALQDIEDDALVGVRSTARLFGTRVKAWVGVFYAATILVLGSALIMSAAGLTAFVGLLAFAAHLSYQVAEVQPDDPALALRLFKSNRNAGLIFALGLIADAYVMTLI